MADTRDDAGWQLYHDTFAALLNRERNRARTLAARLLREYPGHPATRSIEYARESLGIDGGTLATDRPRSLEEAPSSSARAELALFQAMHGIYLGVEFGLLVESESGTAYVALALAGGAAGAAISLEAVPDVTSGRRALLNGGVIWGVTNAALLLVAIDPEVDSAAPIVLPLMAGQLGGLAVGASMFRLNPTAGQVGLVNSGAQWAGAITGLLLGAVQPDFSDQGYALAILAAVDGGLGLGAYLASRYPRVSRAQTLVLDAGGIFGAVAGGGAAVLVQNDFDRSALLGAAIGAAAGLGVTAYLTRDWASGSNDDGGATTFLAPPSEGRGAVAGMGWRW